MQELSHIEQRVLKALGEIGDQATPEQIKEKGGFGELVQVMNGSSWLQAKGLVRHEETMRVFVGLAKEGLEAVARGLPERRVAEVLARHGGQMLLTDVQKAPELSAADVNVGV